jgi:hypothetical protein
MRSPCRRAPRRESRAPALGNPRRGLAEQGAGAGGGGGARLAAETLQLQLRLLEAQGDHVRLGADVVAHQPLRLGERGRLANARPGRVSR